jgi:membrane fusion protein, adhesin transport system
VNARESAGAARMRWSRRFASWLRGGSAATSPPPPRLSQRDLDLLSDDTAALLEHSPLAAHLILWGAAAFLVIALIWASVATVDEVTRAQGQVIPSSRVQVVQNLEGGIVQEILVREGEPVNRGQVLLRIDPTRFASTYEEGRQRELALRARLARLEAETAGTDLAMPDELAKDAPQLVLGEQRVYEARALELASTLGVLHEQLVQKRQELRGLQSRAAQLERSVALLEDELERTAPLAAEGVVSEVELLRLRRQVNDTRGDLSAARTQIPQAHAAVGEIEGKIAEARARFRAEAQGQLAETRAELAALTESNFGARDRLERTQVRSPVKGVVKRLHVTTVGGVVQPGNDIVEVVPLEDTLLVEGRVKPRDIAFLHPGQRAIVKLTAYDYAIYGGLEARLEHISADTVPDPDRERDEREYLIRVRTERATLSKGSDDLPIIPGMTASVDVLTGRKTVLHYLLKPVFRARERALRER